MTTALSTLRFRAASLAVLVSCPCALGASAALAASPGVPSRALDEAQRPASAPANDPGLHGAVSRARMLECGHQWNNMKRAGTAAGTWKDFSRVCLAQR